MCGIIYKSNYYTKTDCEKFIRSCDLLRHKKVDNFGYYFNQNHCLGHLRLNSVDNNYIQPIIEYNKYLIFDGNLTNYHELTNSKDERVDSLLVFKLLERYGIKALNKINGAYAFIYVDNDKTIAVRDRFGIKPLYYSVYEKDIIIANEIKAILNYIDESIVNKEGLCELLGMGPSHSIGKTIYKNIYEVPPGHYLEYDKDGLTVKEYYDINAYKIEIPYSEAVKKAKSLVVNSILSNIPTDKNVSCLLSGGLDSSIVAKVVSDHVGNINTYLIDYEDNEEEFIPNSYEITKDKDYARLVSKDIKSNHNEIIIDNNTLFDNLKKAVEYRDSPGMTDIDSSLIYLASEISKTNRVCLTGECADEIFAGYKWYYEPYDNKYGFPWIKSLEFKENLLNDKYKLNLKDYVVEEYSKAINKCKLSSKTKLGINHQQLCYMNIKYCMTNLLNRNDAMTRALSINSLAPFCDYKIIELLYNLPLSYKYRLKTEKKLLRDCFKKEVIKPVLERKKSPYPKSRSKGYETKVKEELLNILNSDSILNELFDKDKLLSFINDDKEMEEPWYGQLMRKTSFLAYLYQIDYWYKKYNIRIEI